MDKLTLIPIGGLANRIYAITSAIAYCQAHSIPLKIVWFKDWGMGADFHSLFKLSPAIKDVEILKSATTRLYDTEAKIICIVSKKGAQCIECHHKDI